VGYVFKQNAGALAIQTGPQFKELRKGDIQKDL
jgi:hypothetical protein